MESEVFLSLMKVVEGLQELKKHSQEDKELATDLFTCFNHADNYEELSLEDVIENLEGLKGCV